MPTWKSTGLRQMLEQPFPPYVTSWKEREHPISVTAASLREEGVSVATHHQSAELQASL